MEGRSTVAPAELPSLVRSVLSYAAHWLGRRSRGRCARLEVSGATTADSSASTLRRVFGHSNLVCGQGSVRNVATMRRQSGYERQLSFTWHRELTAALPGWRERAGDSLLRDDPALIAIGDLLEAAVKSGHACIASFNSVAGPPTRHIGKTEDGRVITMVATQHVGDHIIRGSLLVSGVRVRHEVKERHVWISNSGDSCDVVDSQDSPDAYLSILAASVRPDELVTFDAGSDERGRYFDCRFGNESRGEVYNTVVSSRSSATYRYYRRSSVGSSGSRPIAIRPPEVVPPVRGRS
ncbi:MAG: hypothetical protein U0271_39930 [Polyangiaceae bacterium]